MDPTLKGIDSTSSAVSLVRSKQQPLPPRAPKPSPICTGLLRGRDSNVPASARSVESVLRTTYSHALDQPSIGFKHDNLRATLNSPSIFRATLLQVMPLNARQLDCSQYGQTDIDVFHSQVDSSGGYWIDRFYPQVGRHSLRSAVCTSPGFASFSHGNTRLVSLFSQRQDIQRSGQICADYLYSAVITSNKGLSCTASPAIASKTETSSMSCLGLVRGRCLVLF